MTGMKIVVPKETYSLERRVMVLPSSAKTFAEAGHTVFVQAGAGSGIDIPDKRYVDAGAVIISDAVELYAQAQAGMVIKIKAPSAEEFSFMRRAILFCMLHIEQNRDRLFYMGSQELVGVAMEEIHDEKDKRLVDQTDITGQMGVFYAIRHFQKLPSDMRAVILGYGHVANGAITACSRLGIDFKIMRRRELKHLPLWLKDADLLINAISWPEKQREKQEYLVTREDIRNSNPGMIVLDLAVDFPNPIETIHSTNYQNPFYIEEDRVHISIYGYPGLVPVTSSRIYSEQVLPIALAIANNGGLKDIKKVDGLGPCIHPAIVDPSRYEWERYKPPPSQGPRIE
jgi:alanine dehydrogenase